MKLIVRERVSSVAEPVKKVFNVTVDAVNNFGKIPASIGLKKGDLLVYRGPGDVVRLPAGTVAGRILVTDPDSETGWSVVPNSSGGGSTASLHNITGVLVKGGTVVKISSNYDFIKATAADTTMLFVTADDCAAGADVDCYGVANTICSILCTADAVAVNDRLAVSATDGLAEATAGDGFAVALSAKAAGSVGAVDAMIVRGGFLPLSGGKISGDLTVEKGSGAKIVLSNADGNFSEIIAYKPSQNVYGSVLVVNARGNAVIGGGEFAASAFSNNIESCQDDNERLLLGSDTQVYIIANAQTIANRKTWVFGTDGSTQLPAALGIAFGGTGAATAAAARTNLGLTGMATKPPYSLSSTDLTPGVSALENGKLYFVYE